MKLIPFDSDATKDDGHGKISLTGIEVTGGDRKQILQALRLNRRILHGPQPDAVVDEASVRATIDDLLGQLAAKQNS